MARVTGCTISTGVVFSAPPHMWPMAEVKPEGFRVWEPQLGAQCGDWGQAACRQ